MSIGFVGLAFTLASVLAPAPTATSGVSPVVDSRDDVEQEIAGQPDVPPRAIKLTKPKYPKAAFHGRVEGTVEVEFLIDAKGRVVNTRLIRSIPALDAAAIECVRKWRFQPAEKAGRAVATVARAPVTFRIYSKPE